MKVGEICNREVVIVRKNESLLEAGKRMRHFHVGSLVVVEEQDDRRVPVGIITDRDILLEVLVREIPMGKLSVGDMLTKEVITAREENDIFETIQMMRDKGIRRVPVVSEWGDLVGILTMDDMLEIVTEEIKNLSSIFSSQRKQEEQLRP